MSNFFQQLILSRIEQAGRSMGSPTIIFGQKNVIVTGEDLYLSNGLINNLFKTSAFYLSLSENAFGVVIYPDGSAHNMAGGMHMVPPGLYRLKYVDKNERFDFTTPVSETTRDGKKLTITVLVRYRVVDPVVILHINNPIGTLIEHIQADVIQYIHAHNHIDIMNSLDSQMVSKTLSFFNQRHINRYPISRAIIITGVEIKEFLKGAELEDIYNKAKQKEQNQTKYQKDRDKLTAGKEAKIEVQTPESTKYSTTSFILSLATAITLAIGVNILTSDTDKWLGWFLIVLAIVLETIAFQLNKLTKDK